MHLVLVLSPENIEISKYQISRPIGFAPTFVFVLKPHLKCKVELAEIRKVTRIAGKFSQYPNLCPPPISSKAVSIKSPVLCRKLTFAVNHQTHLICMFVPSQLGFSMTDQEWRPPAVYGIYCPLLLRFKVSCRPKRRFTAIAGTLDGDLKHCSFLSLTMVGYVRPLESCPDSNISSTSAHNDKEQTIAIK